MKIINRFLDLHPIARIGIVLVAIWLVFVTVNVIREILQ